MRVSTHDTVPIACCVSHLLADLRRVVGIYVLQNKHVFHILSVNEGEYRNKDW